MKQDLGPKANGLLSEPGSASSSFLSPDGGGSRSSPDGGGSGRPRRSGILMEALIKSNAALVADELPATAPVRPSPSPAPPAPAPPPYPQLFLWDAAVRVDLIKTNLLSQLSFQSGATAGVANATVASGKSVLPWFWISDPAFDVGTSGSLLHDQAAHVRKRASKRADRLAEIYSQMDDLLPFWETVIHVTPANAPRTMELMQVAVLLSHSVVMQPKHMLACPRPSDIDFRIAPMVDVPGHASFPSGHATAAYALTELLLLLLPAPAPAPAPAPPRLETVLRRLAYRVAENREIAGIHYPIDSVAGQLLGTSLARLMAAAANGLADIAGWKFDAAALDIAGSQAIAKRNKALDATDLASISQFKITNMAAAPVAPCPFMKAMWQASLAEIARLPLRY